MKGLKFVSLWGAQGYADGAERYLAALAERGVPVSWHPMHYYGQRGGLAPVGAVEVVGHPLQALWQRPVDYDTVLFNVIPHAGLAEGLAGEAGVRRLVMTAWETDRLRADWPPLLNQVEGVVVHSRWNAEVFAASGVRTPLSVVPHLPAPRGAVAALTPALPADRVVFYSIGEWTRRKAYADLLAAYWRAFSAADPVLLVLKTSPMDYIHATQRPGLRRLWRWLGTTRLTLRRKQIWQRGRYAGPPAPVRLLDAPWPAEAIAGLHARGDCYVSLAHGEGWGLGAYEAARAGTPVIVTGWGGWLDFLPAEAAYHVPYRLTPANGGSMYEAQFTPDQCWAQADIPQAGALMRQVFEQRAEAQARGRALQAYVAEHFNPDSIVDRLLRALAG